MARLRLVFGLLGLVLVSLGGCPTNGGGGGGGGSSDGLVGTWTGTLNCQTTQTVGTSTTDPVDSTLGFSITFGSDGLPTGVLILGFANAPDAQTDAVESGDQATLTGNAGSVAVTNEIEVLSALYLDESADIEYRLTYSGDGGNLQQSGTGTQSITLTLTGEQLSVEIQTTYDVTQTVSGLQLTSGEVTECSGTLTRQ